MTKHHNTPIDRDTQERMRRKYDGGGSMMEEERRSGTGYTNPIGNGRYQALG